MSKKYKFEGYIAKQPNKTIFLSRIINENNKGEKPQPVHGDGYLTVDDHHDFIELPSEAFPDLKRVKKAIVTVEEKPKTTRKNRTYMSLMKKHTWDGRLSRSLPSSCKICGCVREIIDGKVTYFINDNCTEEVPDCK